MAEKMKAQSMLEICPTTRAHPPLFIANNYLSFFGVPNSVSRDGFCLFVRHVCMYNALDPFEMLREASRG